VDALAGGEASRGTVPEEGHFEIEKEVSIHSVGSSGSEYCSPVHFSSNNHLK